ncbi:Aldehyde dehydrogenase [hydrothermal vent metagenome]|uniref:Aldehyde dehydrogenase n=1 Tax=hydrothermal vent metagenome TaxID=652676 RepID=A0A3B0S291_9ZZZZ
MTQIPPYWQNYIDGKFVDGGAGWLVVEDPATGDTVAEQAIADSGDVDVAVQAAKRCHESSTLTDMRPVERGRLVRQLGDYLIDNLEAIADVLCLEMGKPHWEACNEVRGAARYFEYYGAQAETLEGRSIPLGANYLDFTVLEPYGVSAQIIPWNFPLEIASRSLAAGLATGNACVIKTPELTPLSSGYLAKAAEAVGLPAGSVNIFSGYGTEAGAALAAHPLINQMVFTGSVATGVSIATAAAQNIVPCVLELGGKSAAVIYDDADMEAVVASVRRGIFYNAGQICSALSRLVVHESIHDQVVEQVVELANSIELGPGTGFREAGLNMGAMVSQNQRDRAASMCEDAERQGAVLAIGGHRLNRPGYFLEPTVFTNVSPDMTIAQEEVFGPVLSVMKFVNDEQAIEIANGTQYGLVGGVFTKDLDRATTTAKQLRAGQIFVNEWFAGGVETPFGGYGKSGYGREKGREALLNYVQTKNIAIAV